MVLCPVCSDEGEMEMAIIMVALLLHLGDGRLRRCRHGLFHVSAFSTPVMERY
jgi:hypothetical protein